jgi:hypothetical protein
VALGGVAGVLGGANEGEDGRERGHGVFICAMASVAGVAGRGATGWHWPSWAVASSAGLCVRGAVGFWTGRLAEGVEMGVPTVQSRPRAQVLNSGHGI